MELLLYSDEDEKDSGSDLVVTALPNLIFKTPWDNVGDDSSDSDVDEILPSSSSPGAMKETIGLGKEISSAKALMESVVNPPSFLNSEKKFEVPILLPAKDFHTESSTEKRVLEKRKSLEFKPKMNLQDQSSHAQVAPKETAKLPVPKETAKDRVKKQRLAGQSGIGSDFKEWRSEEEMRQRQMYD